MKMSEIKMNISFPFDEDKFFRRQCPLCKREFKVLLEENEIEDNAKKSIESFMLEEGNEKGESENDQAEEYYCPYCGQTSTHDCWWTDGQAAYLKIYIENIMKDLINKNLINPLKRKFNRPTSGPISIKYEGNRLEQEQPWISPEENNMKVFDLPCCDRVLKIREEWKDKVHCFFCGFPHKYKQKLHKHSE